MNNQARIVLSAEDRTSAAFASVSRGFDKIGISAAAAQKGVAALAAGFSFGAVAASIKSAANYADELGKLAQRAGTTTEAISALAYAASLSDVDNKTLAKGLRELGNDAQEGGKKLSALGVSVLDTAGKVKTSEALLSDVADRLAGVSDPARRAALAAQLFGDKVGPELIPLLSGGSAGIKAMTDEAARFGRVVDEEAAANAAKFNDNLTRLQARASGFASALSNEVIPKVNDIVDAFLAADKGGNGFAKMLGGPLRVAMEATSVLAMDVGYVLTTLGDTAGAYLAVSERLLKFDIAGAKAVGAAYREASEERRLALDTAQLRILNPALTSFTPEEARKRGLNPPASPPPGAGGSGGGGGRGGRATLTEAQKAEQQYQADLLKYAADEDAYRQRMFLKRIEEQDAIEKQYQDDLLQYEQDLDDYRQRMFAKRIEEEEKEQLESAERVRKAAEEAIAAQQRQAEKLGDAFASTFDRAFRDGMKLGDLIKKLAFDAINIAFLTPATQALGSSLGKAANSLFASFDGGGYTGSGSRSGGIDGKGGFMAVLHPNETVLDHTKGQGMGGGTTIVQNISIDARGADAGVDQRIRAAMEQTRRETLAAVRANVNRGGSWAQTMGRA